MSLQYRDDLAQPSAKMAGVNPRAQTRPGTDALTIGRLK